MLKRSLCFAFVVLVLLQPTRGLAGPFDPPAVDKPFRGTATGTVKWVHDSTWWFMFDIDEVEPESGDASTYREWVDEDKGIKIVLRWGSPTSPVADQHAFIKSLKPGQKLTLELEPGPQPKSSVRLASVPAGTGGGGEAGGGNASGGGDKQQPSGRATKFGPGKYIAPEERGASIDESVIRHTIRIDPDAAAAGGSDAFASLADARDAIVKHLRDGEATRVVLSAGTHRGSLGTIDATAGKTIDTLLVLEGAGKGQTVVAGSERLPADRWEDLGDGLYRVDWNVDWGNFATAWETPQPLGHRAEMVFVDGELMDQVLIEAHDYSITGELMDHGNRKQRWEYVGFRDPTRDPSVMPAGTFGVAEKDENGNFLYVRLPGGKGIDGVEIEVSAERQFVRFDAGDHFTAAKNNLVLRGITFRHYASRTKDWGSEDTIALGRGVEQLLIEDCGFNWNNSAGLRLFGNYVTIRDSEFNHNGMSGLAGQLGQLVMEDTATNYNNWRGAWGGMYGWNWGGVKFGGEFGGNQTIRDHEAIGNLTHGFWYDIHPYHVDIDGLVAVENWQTGLDLELAYGPYHVKRALLAGNRKFQFTMSIVGDFTVEDSIMYATDRENTKLKKDRVPNPVANLQWYLRTDEHADRRPNPPKQFVFLNNVLATPSPAGGIFLEHNGFKRNLPEYGMVDRAYRGEGNLFFAQSGRPRFTYVDSGFKAHTVGLDGWQDWTREADVTVADPGFSDPGSYDFTLTSGSPLQGRASELPTIRVDPEKIAEARRFREWHKRARELNSGDAGSDDRDAGVPEPD